MSTGGFILGAKTALELNLILLKDTIRPLLPDTRDCTITISGVHGTYDFGGMLKERIFNLKCAFINVSSTQQLQNYIRNLTDFLTDDYGKPKKLKLIFEDDNKYYLVRYAGTVPLKQLVTSATFDLPLVAHDPHAYGEENTINTNITTSPGSIEIENIGNVVTYPIITITNTGTNNINGFSINLQIEEDDE